VARKKITLACRQLAEQPFRSIKEIADSAGIEDQHYFSRLFKKVTGMTPLTYRQMTVR
jgi:YesN/AraC family two-component response regulator